MKSIHIARLPVLLALCLVITACAGPMFRNYGRIAPSSEANQSFQTYQVNPEFRYYITGSEIHPNALIGLHRNYQLDPNTTWKEVDMTPEKMKDFIQGMQSKASEFDKYPQGFNLIDDKGKVIGVWYSILSALTFVHMQEGGIVRIDTPNLDTYERLAPKSNNADDQFFILKNK
jgi:hypothetical protein